MTQRRPGRFAVLAVFVLLCAAPASAGDGWWGKLDEGEAVSLKDILAAPRDYQGRTLTFFCIYHGQNNPQYFDPMRTPFNAKRYVNFSVWPDGTALWDEREFKKYDVPFLYIPRTHAQRDGLLSLRKITRIEITGKVRAVLRGSPCIEAFSFRETGHRLSKDIVKAVNWGDNYARMGTRQGDQRAAGKYRDALAPDLPPVYDMMVRKRLAGALRRLGHMEDADRVENGEIIGGGSIPEPQPGEMPIPFEPGPPPSSDTGELPSEPVGDIGPPPAAPDLPGAPLDAPPTGAFPASGDFPPPAPGAGELPGAPFNPSTADSDLPGERAGSGDATPRAPGAAAGAAPRKNGTPPPRPRGLRGIPPKRRPRLGGVK